MVRRQKAQAIGDGDGGKKTSHAAKRPSSKKGRALARIRHPEIELLVRVPGYMPKSSRRFDPAKTDAARRARLLDDAIDELAELLK